jgi:hypothetical protein
MKQELVTHSQDESEDSVQKVQTSSKCFVVSAGLLAVSLATFAVIAFLVLLPFPRNEHTAGVPDGLMLSDERYTYKVDAGMGYLSLHPTGKFWRCNKPAAECHCPPGEPSLTPVNASPTADYLLHTHYPQSRIGTYTLDVTSDGTVMSNGLITITTSALGGRLAQIEHAGMTWLYVCPEAHYRGECSTNFAKRKGISVFGGNFLTFPSVEHGMYYDDLFDMASGYTHDSVWTEFWKTDTGATDRVEPKFANYPQTGATFRVRFTLRHGEDFVRVSFKVHYPKKVDNTAVWFCETWSPGVPKGQDTWTTKKATMVVPADVKVRDVSPWGWLGKFKDSLPADFSEIASIHDKWVDPSIAYIDTPWLALMDRGTAFVSYSQKAQAIKLWSWGRDVFNQPLSSDFQPYFEPWRSPLNVDFTHGDPVEAGQTLEWEELLLPLTKVDESDVPGLRARIEAKIDGITKVDPMVV